MPTAWWLRPESIAARVGEQSAVVCHWEYVNPVSASRCIVGIEANRERCLEYVRNSIGLVTALNPVLGYERSAAIAKEALKSGGSVYDLVLQKGWLTRESLDDLLKPENMTHPRKFS